MGLGANLSLKLFNLRLNLQQCMDINFNQLYKLSNNTINLTYTSANPYMLHSHE